MSCMCTIMRHGQHNKRYTAGAYLPDSHRRNRFKSFTTQRDHAAISNDAGTHPDECDTAWIPVK